MANLKLRPLAVIFATLVVAFSVICTAAPANGAIPTNLSGIWRGTISWRNGAESHPVVVTVTRSNPLSATIDVVGVCRADWTERSRSGDSIVVRAHVVASGRCGDNTWNLRVTSRQMSGPDGGGSFISISRAVNEPKSGGSGPTFGSLSGFFGS